METKQIDYAGYPALELTTRSARMVVITGMGPRVAFFGKPGGENLFSWFPADWGRGDWRLIGGHRVWVTRPGADESEDTYAADPSPCSVTTEGDRWIITSGEHPFLKVTRGLSIRSIDECTFEVTAFLTNTGGMLYSGGVWAVTCTHPLAGTTYGIPLGDRSKAWDLITVVIPRRWAGNTARVDDPQYIWGEDFLVVRPEGSQSKRMLSAPSGALVMSCPTRGVSFIKQSMYHPQGQYPLGCNLAVFIGGGNFTVEMESYGAEQTVQPGGTICNMETWRLVDEVFDWQSLAAVEQHLPWFPK